jgi:mevalonate kinase
MKKITVSAPGKLMLFGEHAVVAGYPCIVTAVNQRIQATIELLETYDFIVTAPEVHINNYQKPVDQIGTGDIPKGVQFVEIAVKNFYEKFNIKKGIQITTSSEFSPSFGFGSSSAITVCVMRALSELLKVKLSQKELFDMCYKTVLDIQGKGSGFDIAAAIYGGTLYFLTGGKVIEPLKILPLPLVVGYSGIKADTVILMKQVSERFRDQSDFLNAIYIGIEQIVKKARNALDEKDFEKIGKLMNENQLFLAKLGVSTVKLDTMIASAIAAGAYGAKLSGAGGGDCMIALCAAQDKMKVENAIEKVNGEIMHVQPNAEGVKLES